MHRGGPEPRSTPPSRQAQSGPRKGPRRKARSQGPVDAAQLSWRGKLRRVERHGDGPGSKSALPDARPARQGSLEPRCTADGARPAGVPPGERPLDPPGASRSGTGSATEPPKARNVANPMVGSRVQQTWKVQGGASRRSREERQGRNELGGWHLRAEGRATPAAGSSEPAGWQLLGAALLPGVDAKHRCRWRGEL